MATEAELQVRVYQTLMSEHGNNVHAALLDLVARYVRIHDGVSAGFLRYGMNDTGADPKVDVPPNPITDEWIATGVDA